MTNATLIGLYGCLSFIVGIVFGLYLEKQNMEKDGEEK